MERSALTVDALEGALGLAGCIKKVSCLEVLRLRSDNGTKQRALVTAGGLPGTCAINDGRITPYGPEPIIPTLT
eukprot:365334-Chlamydomonas_euryale.AAC.14